MSQQKEIPTPVQDIIRGMFTEENNYWIRKNFRESLQNIIEVSNEALKLFDKKNSRKK